MRWAAGLREALWPVDYWMVDVGIWWLLLLACVAGAGVLYRRHGWRLTLVLVGPLAAMVLAAAGGRYPMAMRLSLFQSPLLTLAGAVGLVAAVRLLRRAVPSVREGAGVAAILVPSLLVAVAWVVRMPEDEQGLPEAVSRLDHEWRPGEPVYVFHRIAAEWTYFTTDWVRPDTARLAWVARVAGPDGPAFVNAPPQGPRHSSDGEAPSYRVGDRVELFGVASGIQGRAWLALDPADRPAWQETPDSGWAEVEAARLRQASSPRGWAVLGTDAPNTGIEDLLRAIEAAGGRPELRARRGTTRLYAIEFEPPPPSSSTVNP
jgi:hypothetical protein